jgi:hypothetical protein
MSYWLKYLDPDSDEFRWFLVWLAEGGLNGQEWNAQEIIDVMYESHKYTKEQEEYLKYKKKGEEE